MFYSCMKDYSAWFYNHWLRVHSNKCSFNFGVGTLINYMKLFLHSLKIYKVFVFYLHVFSGESRVQNELSLAKSKQNLIWRENREQKKTESKRIHLTAEIKWEAVLTFERLLYRFLLQDPTQPISTQPSVCQALSTLINAVQRKWFWVLN